MTLCLLVAIAFTSGAQKQPTESWLSRWQTSIVAESKDRYCDRETGEEIGWLISPFLNGYYYGYLATHDTAWIDRLIDWTDSWVRRGVKEPDGFVGWPKQSTGGMLEDTLYTDSLLGEAMALRPVVLASKLILDDPVLKAKYGEKAAAYLSLSEQIFRKWSTRGCWREINGGGVWVVPAFGIGKDTGHWTSGYSDRMTTGFSNPDNKQNLIAEWLVAMYDATGNHLYRDHAAKWWHIMKSRVRIRDGRFYVWDYWDPAGPWDYKPDGSTRHWVGVHPNGGYYGIDVDAIVDAYKHHLVFDKQDIDRLIATNRDYMWDQKVEGAKFKSIGGGPPDPRWANSPGILWNALVPYDKTLKTLFETNFDPTGWGALAATPWYLSLNR